MLSLNNHKRPIFLLILIAICLGSCNKNESKAVRSINTMSLKVNGELLQFQDAHILVQHRGEDDFTQILADYYPQDENPRHVNITYSGELTSNPTSYTLIGITYYENGYSEAYSCDDCLFSEKLHITNTSNNRVSGYVDAFEATGDSSFVLISDLVFANLETDEVTLY